MRIRKFMVVGALAVVVIPWFVYVSVFLIDGHHWQSQSDFQQKTMTQTIKMIAQNESSWSSPQWQRDVSGQLRRHGMEVEIRSPSNKVIFQSVKYFHQRWMSTRQVAIVQDGKWVGTVFLSMPGPADLKAAVAAMATAVLAIILVSFQVGRNVIKPLESMSRAALQIAEGDLEFDLAPSQAVEIRRVRTAFQVMVQGLRDSFTKQQKLEEERRFFIGAIAHDLRTPLFALRGYLDGIAQGVASSPEKIAHYVGVCQDKAMHLERLVSDLFAFTRLEYMEQTVRTEPVNLSDVVTTAITSMETRLREKGTVVDAKTPNHELVVAGDPHLLERALTNLLDNAIRHTPREGKITVELSSDADRIVLKVCDTGPGFSSEDLLHVFEPMYRGDKARSLYTGGAGLGLTISRRIFRWHGGDLLAENSPGGGALLTGWIPAQVS